MAIIGKSEHEKIKLVSDSIEFLLLAEDALLAEAFGEGDALLDEAFREGDALLAEVFGEGAVTQ